MTVLYRGPRGLVTQDAIATDDTGWRRIPVAGLDEVHIVRSQPRLAAGTHRMMSISALLLVIATFPIVGGPAVVLAVVLSLAMVLDVAVSRSDQRRTRWELRAHHAGGPVVLFRSASQREFTQLCRAVQRALERRDDRA